MLLCASVITSLFAWLFDQAILLLYALHVARVHAHGTLRPTTRTVVVASIDAGCAFAVFRWPGMVALVASSSAGLRIDVLTTANMFWDIAIAPVFLVAYVLFSRGVASGRERDSRTVFVQARSPMTVPPPASLRFVLFHVGTGCIGAAGAVAARRAVPRTMTARSPSSTTCARRSTAGFAADPPGVFGAYSWLMTVSGPQAQASVAMTIRISWSVCWELRSLPDAHD